MDLLTEDTSAQTTEAKSENGVEQIAIDSIKAFHNHPFHLYEGERLDDMVESIREHGVLNPVIVLKTEDAYEMLSGHNIANAAKLAGLTEIPAIVKAAVMAAHYDKVCCQEKRNDIIRELQILSGVNPKDTCCHNGNKLKKPGCDCFRIWFFKQKCGKVSSTQSSDSAI